MASLLSTYGNQQNRKYNMTQGPSAFVAGLIIAVVVLVAASILYMG